MAKKVIFYNTYEPVVSLFRDLPQRLSEEGFDVVIVVSRSEYRAKEISLTDHFAGINVTVKRVGIGMPNEVSKRWQKTAVMLSYYLCALFQVMFSRADLRIFLTQPPFFASLGRLKKKLTKEDYICVLMDLYPEVIFANKLLANDGFVGKQLAKTALRSRADAGSVVVIGRDMANYLEGTGVPANIIEYIPNWSGVETPALIDRESNILRSEWGFTPDDFLVVYSGNMGVSHYFDDLLNVAKSLRAQSNIKFVFVGGGPRKKEVVEFKRDHDLQNMFVFDYQPMSRLIESLSAADVHFISLQDGFDGLVVPSKVFGVLSVGRPILFQGSSESEIARMLVDHECGVQINTDDAKGLTAEITAYAADLALAQQHGGNASIAYNTHYSSVVGINKYIDLIQRLLT